MTQRRRQSKREFTLSSIFLSMFEPAFRAEIPRARDAHSRFAAGGAQTVVAVHSGNQDSVVTSDA
jgi:hypothetical protein